MLVMAGASRGLYAANGRRLGAYVYDTVKERLLEGQWRAGEFIGVEALKAELGVSKQPVMDALRRLAGDDLVQIIPQVGCQVPIYPPDEVSDFFKLFASLESEAATIAAARRSESEIARLTGINAQIGAHSDLPDPRDRVHHYRTLNREFHAVILGMAHSSVVTRTSSRMWDMSDLLINASGRTDALADDIEARHAEHELIIEALRARDANGVRDQMRAHILRNIVMLQDADKAQRLDAQPLR
jgi:DNA-binding GntR family transcriptional regulator